MLNDFMLAFIPMFFAMDALGNLAIFAGLTEGFTTAQKRSIIVQSLIVATMLAVSFIFLGQIIFNFLGISMGDFMIAGGVILFCISIVDLVGAKALHKHMKPMEIAAVPLGTPLVVGPAVLTMALMLNQQFGWEITVVAVLVNIFISGVVFLFADRLIHLIGDSGARALSKVMYLLLAAIGVMMVRKGILAVVSMIH